MYTLRDYQEKAVKAGIEFFKGNSTNNSVIVIPTAGGKSLVIANIAKQLDGNTIVFQPSKELLQQNHSKYVSYGEEAGIYSASVGIREIKKVTFATIGSVVKHPELFDEFSNCIVDECDLVNPNESSMYKRFFSGLKLKVLGLTATPVRMKRYNFPVPHSKICMLDRMRPRFFSKYLYVVQIQEMIEKGYFANVEYFDFKFDDSELQVNSSGGDYTELSIENAIAQNSVIEKIVDQFLKLEQEGTVKHILIFVESIASAYAVQKRLGKNKVGVVTGATPRIEREAILNDFKEGKLLGVCNCMVLTVGYDLQSLDCIINGRPTMSLRLYYQIIGRGVRIHPGKEKVRYYDFVGNIKKFGKVSDIKIEEVKGKWVMHNGTDVLTNRDISGENKDIVEEYVNPLDKNYVPKMKFGKFKGTPLNELPKWYLDWVIKNITKDKYNKEMFDWIDENIKKD